jgi:integrase
VIQPNDGNNGFAVNGSRDRQNNFLLDGVDNNDTSVPGAGSGVLGINPDSAQEFRVITNNFNPEFGRNTGAIIDVVTRSGTNNLHGDAYWFGRYNALGARDFFNRAPTAANPAPDPENPYVRNDFGFSVGGPFIKDHTFFFINNEYQRFRTTLTATSIVPTAVYKSGQFTAPDGTQVDLRTPTSPGNLTGLSVDPTISKLLNLLPAPNAGDVIPGVTGLLNFGSPDNLNGYTWTGKIDHKLTNKHQLTLRYAFNRSVDSNPFHSETAPGIDVVSSPAYAHGVLAGLTSTLSNTLVNDFRFGWNKNYAAFDSNCAATFDPITGRDALGNGRDFTVPEGNLGVAPLFTLGCNGLFDSNGQARNTGTTSFTDTITWVKGNHTIKFGGDFRDLLTKSAMAGLRLDEITDQHAQVFAAKHSAMSASGINRGLRTLRRVLNLAYQWGRLEKPVKVAMAKGKRQRDRVLTAEEETKYLAACPQPWHDCATIILDEGFRPGEVFALRWPHILLNDDGTGLIQIVEGKSKGARRVLPMTPRVHALLLARWVAEGKPEDGWVFPAPTDPAKHITDGLTKGQHARALEDSKITSFVPYTMHHTALTRFGEAAGHNIFTVAQIAGHACLTTTKRYVHPQAEAINRVFQASQILVGTKLGTPKKLPTRVQAEKKQNDAV